MKPNRNGVYNLVEFARYLEKIHEDDISLGDLLKYHQDGLPFHFRFGDIVNNKGPVAKELGLSVTPVKISFYDHYNKATETANIISDKYDCIEYRSSRSDYVTADDNCIHKSLSQFLTNQDEPPLLEFSTEGEIIFSRVFKASIHAGIYSSDSIKSPTPTQLQNNGKRQPIKVSCFDITVFLKDCPPELLVGENRIKEVYGDLSAFELIPVVMVSMGIKPKAYKAPYKYKKLIFDKCRKQFPDKFSMSFNSFKKGTGNPFDKATQKGLIKKHQ